MKRPLAYITAPWGSSLRENKENAARYCRQVYDAGFSPICPMLIHTTFLTDTIPQEHKDSLDMAQDFLRRPFPRSTRTAWIWHRTSCGALVF